MEFLKHHKIVIIIAVLVLAIGAWWGLSSGSTPAAPSLVSSQTTTTAGAALDTNDQELVSSLLTLRAVKLDSTIFSNPSFQALRDFSTAIIPETVGRPNPFAPLGQRTVAATSSANSSFTKKTK